MAFTVTKTVTVRGIISVTFTVTVKMRGTLKLTLKKTETVTATEKVSEGMTVIVKSDRQVVIVRVTAKTTATVIITKSMSVSES